MPEIGNTVDLTGRPAIWVPVVAVDGATHHLEKYRGRWLLLVFHRHLA